MIVRSSWTSCRKFSTISYHCTKTMKNCKIFEGIFSVTNMEDHSTIWQSSNLHLFGNLFQGASTAELFEKVKRGHRLHLLLAIPDIEVWPADYSGPALDGRSHSPHHLDPGIAGYNTHVSASSWSRLRRFSQWGARRRSSSFNIPDIFTEVRWLGLFFKWEWW